MLSCLCINNVSAVNSINSAGLIAVFPTDTSNQYNLTIATQYMQALNASVALYRCDNFSDAMTFSGLIFLGISSHVDDNISWIGDPLYSVSVPEHVGSEEWSVGPSTMGLSANYLFELTGTQDCIIVQWYVTQVNGINSANWEISGFEPGSNTIIQTVEHNVTITNESTIVIMSPINSTTVAEYISNWLSIYAPVIAGPIVAISGIIMTIIKRRKV